MNNTLHPRRYTRTEFSGMLLGRLEAKRFPPLLLNRYAKELYTGHVSLDPRTERNFMSLCDLSVEEQAEWRRLYRGGD